MQIYFSPIHFDCYTVVLEDGEVFGMSQNPGSAQGFNQYLGNRFDDRIDPARSRYPVPFNKLPIPVKHAIFDRMGGD